MEQTNQAINVLLFHSKTNNELTRKRRYNDAGFLSFYRGGRKMSAE